MSPPRAGQDFSSATPFDLASSANDFYQQTSSIQPEVAPTRNTPILPTSSPFTSTRNSASSFASTKSSLSSNSSRSSRSSTSSLSSFPGSRNSSATSASSILGILQQSGQDTPSIIQTIFSHYAPHLTTLASMLALAQRILADKSVPKPTLAAFIDILEAWSYTLLGLQSIPLPCNKIPLEASLSQSNSTSSLSQPTFFSPNTVNATSGAYQRLTFDSTVTTPTFPVDNPFLQPRHSSPAPSVTPESTPTPSLHNFSGTNLQSDTPGFDPHISMVISHVSSLLKHQPSSSLRVPLALDGYLIAGSMAYVSAHDREMFISLILFCISYNNSKYPLLTQAIEDYTRAGALLNVVLSQNPNHVQAICNIAMVYRMLNRPSEAERYLRQAIALKPFHGDTIEQLVALLRTQSRNNEALQVLSSVLSLLGLSQDITAGIDSPRYLTLQLLLGHLQTTCDQYVPAAKTFARIILSVLGDLGASLHVTVAEHAFSTTASLNRPVNLGFQDFWRDLPTGVGSQQDLVNPDNGIPGIIRAIDSTVPDGNLYSVTPEQALECRNNVGIKARLQTTPDSTVQMVANALLNLAKILQDGVHAGVANKMVYLNGSVPSRHDILGVYLLSLSLCPSPSTSNNIGILLASDQAQTSQAPASSTSVEMALKYYRFGLSLDDHHPHLYTNLGSLLREQGRIDEAISMYQKAVECDPNFSIALTNLASTFKDQGQVDKAIEFYHRAVVSNPGFVEAVTGLINCQATICYWDSRGGCGWEPFSVNDAGDLVEGHWNGWVPKIVDIVENQLTESDIWGLGVIEYVSTMGRGILFSQIEQALGGYKSSENSNKWQEFWKSWSRHPGEGASLIRIIEKSVRIAQRRWFLAKTAGKQINSFDFIRPQIPRLLSVPAATTIMPFHAFTLPFNARQIKLISEKTATRVTTSAMLQSWVPKTVFPPPQAPVLGTSPLVVGYVSSDFCNHPLSHLMQSVFGMHDPSKVKSICYALTASDNSSFRIKIEQDCSLFRDVSSWSTQRIVEQIVTDGVHVLVNLNGFTRGARNDIFALRPCPVQISLMGFAGPMGADWCDYILGDRIAVGLEPNITSKGTRQRRSFDELSDILKLPDDNAVGSTNGRVVDDAGTSQWVYSSGIIYMPRSFFCCDHRQSAPDATTAHDWDAESKLREGLRTKMFPNLPEDALILGNFNQLYKLDPVTFRSWLKILQLVPNAYLWLLHFPASAEVNLRRYASNWTTNGILSDHSGSLTADINNRIIFTPVAEKDQHLIRSRICDLFLDTPECNAHTTAADVLWSATPILTYSRHEFKMCSRICASVLNAALPQTPEGELAARRLIVHSDQQYIDRAVELASFKGRNELLEIRKLLFKARDQPGGLFDTQQWVRDLERGLWFAWQDYVDGIHDHIYL